MKNKFGISITIHYLAQPTLLSYVVIKCSFDYETLSMPLKENDQITTWNNISINNCGFMNLI